jgi:hypothetical protein
MERVTMAAPQIRTWAADKRGAPVETEDIREM